MTLDPFQLGAPLDQQPYRLVITIYWQHGSRFDPERIRAFVSDAVGLVEMCERAEG